MPAQIKSPSSTSEGATRAQERQLGFRLIVGYKFIKAAIMLAIAIWLTAVPGSAYRALEILARDLTEGGAAFARLGHWIQHHLSHTIMVRGAILAWLDSLSSGLEGALLLSGKPWAHWIVILGLACLLPFEVLSIEHRPAISKSLVLLANLAIVVYLAYSEIRKTRARHR
jgi:uncharacterized membrane protein (DUF2068 family)